jgi:Fe-S-cluster-containing hydrogenase component 2
VQAITLVHGKAVVDVEKCVGCRMCVSVCSYGAPRMAEQETSPEPVAKPVQKPKKRPKTEKSKKQEKNMYSPDAMNALDSVQNEK